jgi:hypothetical protein
LNKNFVEIGMLLVAAVIIWILFQNHTPAPVVQGGGGGQGGPGTGASTTTGGGGGMGSLSSGTGCDSPTSFCASTSSGAGDSYPQTPVSSVYDSDDEAYYS